MSENLATNDGALKSSFNITDWLTNEVKLPQYNQVFIEQGFQLPEQCFQIDDTVLNLLGIDKIGHRKRILVSCQKLGRKYGLILCDVVKPDNACKNDNGENISSDEVGLDNNSPPALPPKSKIKVKPALPPRHFPAVSSETNEQEVNIEVNSSGADENTVDILAKNRDDQVDLSHGQVTEPNMAVKKDEMINSSIHDQSLNTAKITGAFESERKGSLPGLPSCSSDIDYEPLWEATEGQALPLTPKEESGTESLDVNNVPDSMSKSEMSTTTGINKQKIRKQSEKPPPIPPRSDLDVIIEHNVVSSTTEETSSNSSKSNDTKTELPSLIPNNVEINSEEKPVSRLKKQPPKKPPRRSMLIAPTDVSVIEQKERHSLGSNDPLASEYKYDNEVFVPPENQSTSNDKSNLENDELNIYGNFDSQPKMATMPDQDVQKPLAKRPIPAPRSRTLSGKFEKEKSLLSEIPPELPERSELDKTLHVHNNLQEPSGGSCTEDDLSGSDPEFLDENPPVASEYEAIVLPPRASVLQPRHSHKEGYLYKQGGQQNNKGWKKRWVVFDGKELRYYKDREHTNESLQRVPLTIMKEVYIVTEDTRRARFDLTCAGRTYMFALGSDEMDAIQVWAQILMGAIIVCRKESDDVDIPGGSMSDPDKQGFLKKQGNNVVVDFKKRYIAIKEDKFAYYHNREDFIHGSPINTLEMQLASVKIDPKSPLRFLIVTPHRTYVFQCEDERELRSWVSAIESSIQLALSDRTVINKVWENPHNKYCADCGQKDPVWASVNLVVCVCANCIGVHRKLGVHTSKPRSLLMDQKIWKPSLIKLMVDVGNQISNKFWVFMCPEDDKVTPDCTSEMRDEFIRNKYQEKRYRHVSNLFGAPDEIGEALRKSVVTDDIETTMQLVFCGADVKYTPADGADQRTPYELAKDANQELQMEFLFQNGGNIEDESLSNPPKSNEQVESVYNETSLYETVGPVTQPQTIEHGQGQGQGQGLGLGLGQGQVTYEKEGYLQKKAPTAAVWKKRHFALKGRELFYDKGDKDELGVIKLRDVSQYVYNDTVTLDIVTAERTYNLRADTKEEAFSWYTALRNKQVFQIPLNFQELGSDGIPHLVARCVQFVETYGLDCEGIYRKNANKAKIKVLKKLFDQDAESVLLSREEYEPHDVAGLLKEYFRELPDPLLTEDAYPHFITASYLDNDKNHDTKLYTYKESLKRLSDVNYKTLKTMICHLARVCAHSAQNLMKLENVSLIFGPTLMSNEQMGAMDTTTINQEFAVIGDFIIYYKWLFDVDDEQEEKDKKIEEAMKKMFELTNQQNSQHSKVNELILDVYSTNKRQESCRITVDSNFKASQICQEVVTKRGMAPDGNWALFQVANGEIERPFPAVEKVLGTVIGIGQYSQLNKDSYLVVKDNYVAQKMQLYGFLDDTNLVAGNTLQTMKESKRKEKWVKLHIKLEKGVLSVHKNLKSKDDIDSWPVSETTLYLGVEKDRKPVTGFGFTMARRKDNQSLYRYICLDDERELYRWISVFLKLKYPEIPLWVDPNLEPIGYYAEAKIPGKKAPVSKQISGSRPLPGVSSNVVNELRAKQKSLRK